MIPHKTILEQIGNTPLVTLPFESPATTLAKLEYLNPGGSIKDRSALFMIEKAEKTGLLKPGGTIIEASSGNQGIALAMIGAIKGYNVIITLPDRTSPEKIGVLQAYGADVRICPNTDNHDDPRNYHSYASYLASVTPGAFMPNQYFNVTNPLAHYSSTGPEIWEQTNHAVTHVFLATGSCGTITGVGRYLKEKNPAIKIIGVDAATSLYSAKEPKAYQAEGLGIDVISDTLDTSVIDTIVPINDEDAFAMTRRMAHEYGLLVGISSGAVMHTAFQYRNLFTKNDCVVLMFADSGRAYLQKVFAQEEDNTPLSYAHHGNHGQIPPH